LQGFSLATIADVGGFDGQVRENVNLSFPFSGRIFQGNRNPPRDKGLVRFWIGQANRLLVDPPSLGIFADTSPPAYQFPVQRGGMLANAEECTTFQATSLSLLAKTSGQEPTNGSAMLT